MRVGCILRCRDCYVAHFAWTRKVGAYSTPRGAKEDVYRQVRKNVRSRAKVPGPDGGRCENELARAPNT
jgi:hypothetical protein